MKLEDVTYYLMLAMIFVVVPILIIVSVWFALMPETFTQRYATAGGIFIVELAYFWMLLRYLLVI